MSKFTGSTWKVSRRLNYSTSETGKELQKRPYAPGQHGQKRSKLSGYGVQLQEKQKVRFTYNVSEKQLHKTFVEGGKLAGKHGENFLKLLESRLDNIVYRLGFARTRAQARQLVNHGHVTVDGKKVDTFLVNRGFVGIHLTTGNHEVMFKYETPYLKIGMLISGLTLCGIRLVYFRKRKRVM